MTIYVFGNPDHPQDSQAFTLMEQLKPRFPEITWHIVSPNEDVPFIDQPEVVLMDVVAGLDEPRLITDSELDRVSNTLGSTAHDFDLGFQLRYLKKLGKLGKITVLGLPLEKMVDEKAVREIIQTLLS